MATDDHGSCVHCGFDFNGERVYDYFLKKEKDPVKAQAIASMYGCRKGFGRFGKAIYVKDLYDRNIRYFKCPECGGRQ